MNLHQNSNYLAAFSRVLDGVSRDPVDIMKALAVCADCVASGECSKEDKHHSQITEFLNLLAGAEKQ